MNFDDWLQFEAQSDQANLNRFNWDNENRTPLDESNIRTLFRKFVDQSEDNPDKSSILKDFCRSKSNSDKLDGVSPKTNVTFSRLSQLSFLSDRLCEFERIGFIGSDILNLNDAITNVLEDILIKFAYRSATGRDEFDALCVEAQDGLRAAVANFLPSTVLEVGTPVPACTTVPLDNGISFARSEPDTSSPNNDRIAWLTTKQAIISEFGASPTDISVIAASAFHSDLSGLLGLDPVGVLTRKRMFDAYLLYDVDFDEADLSSASQPNMFAGGLSHLFVSRVPADGEGDGIGGRTVRLHRTDCCGSVEAMMSCASCGSPGLPEVVVPQLVINRAALTFSNVFVAIPQFFARYKPPPCDVIRAKNQYGQSEAA